MRDFPCETNLRDFLNFAMDGVFFETVNANEDKLRRNKN